MQNGRGPPSDFYTGGVTPHPNVTNQPINEDTSMSGRNLDGIPLVQYMEPSDVADLDLYAPVPVPEVNVEDLSNEGLSEVRSSKDGSLRGRRPTSLATPLRESQSQIFAYAYGQIEKEKHFGFATETDASEAYGGQVVGKMRPPIELSFIDLSLFLKGSGKKILSNVTGRLSPGRITAVMGPSGAGKTTFLNALAGKATHSRTTGAVFINGRADSIQSFKSIIGFVPQDDIVHGNLTVEENLWFSASYRYSFC